MTRPSRRPATPNQRADAAQARDAKLASVHATLAEQVSALASGPAWRAWLDAAAKFHRYSFNNTLLLWGQRPDATRVAGYAVWKELGRQVNKGEKGLMILAPMTRRSAASHDDGGVSSVAVDPDVAPTDAVASAARQLVGFRLVYVWDISQTSGDPLPPRPASALLAGQAPEGLWDALAAQCAAAGFTVRRQGIDGDTGPNGLTSFSTHEVLVRRDVDDAQAVTTLAHELGHVLMHDPAAFPFATTSRCRAEREVEAESVAYLVAAEYGLDAGAFSFGYVAGWAARADDVGAALRASGARVLATARQILDTAQAQLAGVGDPSISRTVALDTAPPAERANPAGRAAALSTPTSAPVARDVRPPDDRLLDLRRSLEALRGTRPASGGQAALAVGYDDERADRDNRDHDGVAIPDIDCGGR